MRDKLIELILWLTDVLNHYNRCMEAYIKRLDEAERTWQIQHPEIKW